MATIKVLEGELTRKSNAKVLNGSMTHYEFIEIGGTRVMNVKADNLIDTFLDIGDNIALSAVKPGLSNSHTLFAVRETSGQITKVGIAPFLVMGWLYLMMFVFVGAIPAFIAGVATESVAIGIITWVLISFSGPFGLLRAPLKARNALDGKQAQSATTAVS